MGVLKCYKSEEDRAIGNALLAYRPMSREDQVDKYL